VANGIRAALRAAEHHINDRIQENLPQMSGSHSAGEN
jgi:hypothetical protein